MPTTKQRTPPARVRAARAAETTSITPITLGARVRELREANRWTQNEVANRVGITQSNWAAIEAGRLDVKLSTLVRLAQALELPLAELLQHELRPTAR